LSQAQQQQTDDDSTLWLRNLWWTWLNKTQHPTARNLIEQPQDPNEWKEPDQELGLYPSFLQWEETVKVALALGLKASRVEQGALGHPTIKPTALMSDLEEIRALDGLKASVEAQPTARWPSDLGDRLQFSRSLAAWAPGLKAILFKVINRISANAEPAIKKLSPEELDEIRKWETHVRQGHVPYRRDCAVCVEACGRDRAHVRQPTGEAFTMSLDISGPYDAGFDQEIQKPRYYTSRQL